MTSLISLLIQLINWVATAIVILVFLQIIFSYVLSPYHSARIFVDRLVEPMLAPIRRYVPPVGMFDFSPLVLIILVQVVASLLKRLLVTLL
jgi:YggT family protein